MSAEKIIRAQARAVLRGGWMKAIFAFIMLLFVIAFVDCIFASITLLFTELGPEDPISNIMYNFLIFPVVFATAFLLSPILNGYIRMYYKAATNNLYEIKDLFYYFQHRQYAKALVININFALRMLLPSIIAFSPVIAFNVICRIYEPELPMISFFSFILVILSTLITILWSFKYFLVYIYAVDFEYLGTKELFRSSKAKMNGKTGLVAKLFFSYFPWLLLSLTILPMLYTIPYITQGLCICAKWIARSETPLIQEG